MRFLVTGVSGQVGGALVPRLQRLGTVVPVDEHELDFTKLDTMPAILDRLAPDFIINPAAYTAVDKAEDEPEIANLVNAKGPGMLARWAKEHDVPLIHFSTDYVYDGHGDKPWREDDEARPLSVYGSSKLAGDNEVRSSGCCFLIARTSWIYSAHGKNFLRTMARLAQERKELRVVADQVGAPTSAALIADAVVAMLTVGVDRFRKRQTEAGGLVHVVASGETSWHGLARAIVEGLRDRGIPLAVKDVQPIHTDEYPTRAIRPLNSRLDMTRLKKVFGIQTPHWQVALAPELDELAREIVNSQRQLPA
jgi:dTDP-4-dehydrorhamnose reductase